jgi:hypothetical protein
MLSLQLEVRGYTFRGLGLSYHDHVKPFNIIYILRVCEHQRAELLFIFRYWVTEHRILFELYITAIYFYAFFWYWIINHRNIHFRLPINALWIPKNKKQKKGAVIRGPLAPSIHFRPPCMGPWCGLKFQWRWLLINRYFLGSKVNTRELITINRFKYLQIRIYN